MTGEDRFSQFVAVFGKLCRNREQVPLEVLQTRYAKAYNRLRDEVWAGAEAHMEDVMKLCFPRNEKSTAWNEWLDKCYAIAKTKESVQGGLIDQAKKALLDDLDVDEFFTITEAFYGKIEKEIYMTYWNRHCYWTGPPERRWIYNSITQKFWLPQWGDRFPKGCWIKNDYSEPDPRRPPNIKQEE